MGDDSEFLGRRRKLVQVDRQYASFFETSDQQVSEWGVAFTFAESASCEPGFPLRGLKTRGPGEDPPDCEAIDCHGRTVALEVTELVDERALAAAQRGQSNWAPWHEEKVRTAIQVRLTGKDGKHLKGGPYDEYLVLVHSDEPGLSRDLVERALAGHSFDTPKRINRAYLLMSYDPAKKGYPYFPLRFRDAV